MARNPILDFLGPRDRSKRSELVMRGERHGTRVVIRGREVVDFTSWDLLGLQSSGWLHKRVAGELGRLPVTSSTSRLSHGSTEAQVACETRLARGFHAEGALLFSSRNQCVWTASTALLREGDVVLADDETESPILDACQVMGATAVSADLSSPENLANELKKLRNVSRRVVWVDSVRMITGQTLPVVELAGVAALHYALLVVDETAALGCAGNLGMGSVESIGWPSHLLARLAGVGFVLGIPGGALLGPSVVMDEVISVSRHLRTEVGFPPYLAQVLVACLDRIELGLGAREKLATLGTWVRSELAASGWSVTPGNGPIVSLRAATMKEAFAVRDAAVEQGLLSEALPSGAIRRNAGYIRFLLTVSHSDDDVRKLVDGMREIKRRMSLP